MEPNLFTSFWLPLFPNLICIPPLDYAKTPFIVIYFFVFKLVVWFVRIPMTMLLLVSQLIALVVDHIFPSSFDNFFMLGWFQQFSVFICIAHTFFTSKCSLCANKCPSSSLLSLFEDTVIVMLEKKRSTNFRLLNLSPIEDGLPFFSLYGFLVRSIHGILGLCFLSKELSSSSEGSP
jgi:hypothetical protein